jgi:hypothetical protein
MSLTKQQVIERFCALGWEVMNLHFKFERAADCFCGSKRDYLMQRKDDDFRYDEKVIEFIERAVSEKLDRDALEKPLVDNKVVVRNSCKNCISYVNGGCSKDGVITFPGDLCNWWSNE